MPQHPPSAFSLVELSIVLVILGLLVGGILAGQSLIRASELRSVSSDISRFRTALYSFRDKYFYLPGDLPNATKFWGDDNTNCPDAAVTNGTPGTCNGTGDGKIYYSSVEPAALWQHLALAGMVEGTYILTGAPIAPGSNIAAGKIPQTGYLIYWAQLNGNMSSDSADPNRIMFGKPYTAGGSMGTVALKPEELWNIDTKLDDGLPAGGKMLGRTGAAASGNCTSGTAYDLANSGIACYFLYTLD